MSEWMNSVSIKMWVGLCQVAVASPVQTIPNWTVKFLIEDHEEFAGQISSPFYWECRPWPWRSGMLWGVVQIWWGDSLNLSSFHFSRTEGANSLDNALGSPHQALKKGSLERLKVVLSPVHESTVILLLSMSRAQLFTLTLVVSNLYSGLSKTLDLALSSSEGGFCDVTKSCNRTEELQKWVQLEPSPLELWVSFSSWTCSAAALHFSREINDNTMAMIIQLVVIKLLVRWSQQQKLSITILVPEPAWRQIHVSP